MMKRILAGSATLFLALLSAAAQAVPIVSGSVWIVPAAVVVKTPFPAMSP